MIKGKRHVNLEIDIGLWRAAKVQAAESGETLVKWLEAAITEKLKRK